MGKRFIRYTNYITFSAFLLLLGYACENDLKTLTIKDHLIYFDSRIVFSNRTYTVRGDTAILETTVTIPNDIVIVDCGHCWITSDGNPTVSDQKFSFGKTDLKSFKIISKITNYTRQIRYYYRAYLITNSETIYDLTYYFK